MIAGRGSGQLNSCFVLPKRCSANNRRPALLEHYLDAYVTAAGIGADKASPLFRTLGGRGRKTLTEGRMARQDARRMIVRRAGRDRHQARMLSEAYDDAMHGGFAPCLAGPLKGPVREVNLDAAPKEVRP
jgi:hypothetical protein